MRWKNFALPAAAALLLAVGGTAFAIDNNNDKDSDDVTNDTSQLEGYIGTGGLHEARLDLARRLGIEPGEVTVRHLAHAGWDGCLGVHFPDALCTMQFIGGYVGTFEADGEEYRYHFGGDRFAATDFADEGAIIRDGLPVEPALQADLNGALADYVEGDLELREDAEPGEVTVRAVVPVDFPNACLGFQKADQDACAEVLVSGAIVLLQHDGEEFRYHVSSMGVIATDFEQGQVTVEVPAGVAAVQDAMREDLAERLGVDVSAISVATYRDVTWPNGCLGIEDPAATCLAEPTEGFLAFLEHGGEEYRYHGSADHFIAASFVGEHVQVTDPQ